MRGFSTRTTATLVLALAAALLALGCNDVDVPALGPKVLTLSKALNSANRKFDRKLDGREFLAKACEKDPDLLAAFEGCDLKVDRGSLYVGLLVCDEGGREVYYEDLSCTGAMEKNHSKVSPRPPCEFTLNPNLDCPRPANGLQ